MAYSEINDLTLKATPASTDEIEIQETTGGSSFKTTIGAIGGSGDVFNWIMNSQFLIWRRGTSFTATGYSADRWAFVEVGATATLTRQAFTIGQTDVPFNPKYFLRCDVTVAGSAASDQAAVEQRIEDVTALSGESVTISFWAKADASKNIAAELYQDFGTGGTPSADVSISQTTCALTTTWSKFTINATVTSVSGKTLGTNNDDSLRLKFWADAGSTYNSNTNTLGHQTITMDIANVQLETGSTANDLQQISPEQEMEQCQRYYQELPKISYPWASDGGPGIAIIQLPVPMRATPTVTWGAPTNIATGPTLDGWDDSNSIAQYRVTFTVATNETFSAAGTTLDAEL